MPPDQLDELAADDLTEPPGPHEHGGMPVDAVRIAAADAVRLRPPPGHASDDERGRHALLPPRWLVAQ